MSLACLALRQITRRALENQTLAEDRVRDSELTSLEALVNQGADGASGTKPFISLYIDQTGGDGMGKDWNSADGTVHLLVEIAIAAPVEVTPTDQDVNPVSIPETSAGLEISLDLLAYQVKVALLGGLTPWSDLWQGLVLGIASVETYRGAEFRRTGSRFAARQIDLALSILNDPVPGEPPVPYWADIIAAFAADPEFDDLATAMQTVINGKPLPQWRRDAFELGYSTLDMQELGDAPLDGSTAADLVAMAETTLLDDAADALDPDLTITHGLASSFGA